MSDVPHARTRTWLVLGAVAGLVAALGSITLRHERAAVPDDAVATVNGTPIRVVDLERAIEAVSADRRAPLDARQRRAVLERLIEEELLVQRARTLGLDAHDRSVRARLVTAVIEGVLAGAESTAPAGDAGAERVPSSGPRLWVRTVRVERDRTAAEAAAARLRRGEDADVVARELGAPDAITAPPGGLVPVATLREYIGPALTDRALALAPGEVAGPIADGPAFHVLQLVSREDAPAPPALAIEAELRRRAEDRALRRYVDDLRAAADVRVRE